MRLDGSEVRKLTDSHRAMRIPSGRLTELDSVQQFPATFKDEDLLDEWGPQPYGDPYVIHADGSGVRQLTNNRWEEPTPAWRPNLGGRASAGAGF